MIRRYGSVGSLRPPAVDFLKIGANHARTQTVLSEADSTWYVQIGKKQHNLGPDEQVAKQSIMLLWRGVNR